MRTILKGSGRQVGSAASGIREWKGEGAPSFSTRSHSSPAHFFNRPHWQRAWNRLLPDLTAYHSATCWKHPFYSFQCLQFKRWLSGIHFLSWIVIKIDISQDTTLCKVRKTLWKLRDPFKFSKYKVGSESLLFLKTTNACMKNFAQVGSQCPYILYLNLYQISIES